MEIMCNIGNKFGNGGNSTGNIPCKNEMEELTDSIICAYSFECVFENIRITFK